MITTYGNRLFSKPINVDDKIRIFRLYILYSGRTFYGTLADLKYQAEFLIKNRTILDEYKNIKEKTEVLCKEWFKTDEYKELCKSFEQVERMFGMIME